MNTYLVITSDMEGVPDFLHPSQIYGKDKLDVQTVMQQDIPAEYIKGIYTPQEYLSFIKTEKFKTLLISYNPGLGQNQKALQNFIGNLIEYIKDIINSSSSQESNNASQLSLPETQINQIEQKQVQVQSQETNQNIQSTIQTQAVQKKITIPEKQPEIKYFNDNGIQFKLENGQLYKKIWENVNLDITTDQNGNQIYPEIRLINIETNKPTKSSKIGVQKLVWKKLN